MGAGEIVDAADMGNRVLQHHGRRMGDIRRGEWCGAALAEREDKRVVVSHACRRSAQEEAFQEHGRANGAGRKKLPTDQGGRAKAGRCAPTSLVIPTVLRLPGARIAARLMMLLGMWLAPKLGLVVKLLSGLLVFQLIHVLASTVEDQLRPGRARANA